MIGSKSSAMLSLTSPTPARCSRYCSRTLGSSSWFRPSCRAIKGRSQVDVSSYLVRQVDHVEDGIVARRNDSGNPEAAHPAEGALSRLCAVLLAGILSFCPLEALANEKVAEFAASGLLPLPGVFRDTVQVVRLTDPGVEGVSLYFTDYSRSLVEKLSSDPFADPSQSSITCVATGPIKIKDPEAAAAADGEEIFSELKTLNIFQNKRLRVRRIYDKTNGAIIYVSYSTRFTSTSDEGGVSSSRYRTSTCALPLQSFS